MTVGRRAQGAYINKTNSTACSLCGYGAYSLGASTGCTLCDPQYNTTTIASGSASACLAYCTDGVGLNGLVAAGKTSCFACLNGTYAARGALACDLLYLPAARTWNGSAIWSSGPELGGACKMAGFTDDRSRAVALGCPACQAGYYQSAAGMTFCSICSQAHFLPSHMSLSHTG